MKIYSSNFLRIGNVPKGKRERERERERDKERER